jgi:hypothetical protein
MTRDGSTLRSTMARQRRFLACMAAGTLGVAVLQAVLGSSELVLAFSPLLLIAGLLLCGRFVGEERLVARLARLAAPLRRHRAGARWRPAVERPLASLLARSPRLERGPPAALVTAA